MSEKCEFCMGADSLKSTLETEDHVLKAEHIDPIKSCLIRDDLHMRAHLCSKGRLLTPALKVIQWTRAKFLLQWHAENRHENIIFMDEKIFTIEEQYNNQNSKIYAQTSLEVRSEGAENWFSGSADLKTLDNKLWALLEGKACTTAWRV
jgi:hypothetical protein